jgi:hypothetical protein
VTVIGDGIHRTAPRMVVIRALSFRTTVNVSLKRNEQDHGTLDSSKLRLGPLFQ